MEAALPPEAACAVADAQPEAELTAFAPAGFDSARPLADDSQAALLDGSSRDGYLPAEELRGRAPRLADSYPDEDSLVSQPGDCSAA